MPTDARVIPEAVQWREGMLLSPQHFQLAARRAEALAAYMMGAATPLCWGVQRLQIDQSLLLEAVFRIIELEAVMPDGLLVLYPMGDDEPRLELDLRAVFGLVWRNQGGAPPSSGKEWDAGGGNYAASIFGGSARAGAVGA